ESSTAGLAHRGGAFVTLYRGRELRGCIGRVSERTPLSESVPELALSAALDDSRFRPLDPLEEDLSIEISVLSPLKRVRTAHSFRLGEHGAALEAGSHRGLLLPKVPTEHGWTRQQFFDALANKAGAGAHAYEKAGTRLFVFRAQAFQDRRP
ncbi:MAG: AmmeMemoRadiSam system protein A, partial [Bryobacteraceae bacterium]